MRSDPHYCDGCTPPLTYAGGPLMDTNGSAGMTITPIYWAPSGSTSSFPSTYESIINGYVKNLAEASNTPANVYSIDTEYYATVNGTKVYVTYNYKAGAPITDGDSFPSNGCTPLKGYTACITDAQIRTELTHLVATKGLKTGLDEIYPVFFPPGVETQDADGTNSVSSFCGYHRAFGSGAATIVYSNMPYEQSGCDGGQAPNGNLQADGAVSTLSHEVNETVTDPTDATAWNDSTGHEIGDICTGAFGPALGSTSSSAPGSTEYNQVINGTKYYTQEEFSNLAFSKLGAGNGCQQSESNAQHLQAGSPTAVASIFSDTFPASLPANGNATSKDLIVVGDNQSFGISGDHVSFSEYLDSGSGSCGTLSEAAGTTKDDGSIEITYTASTSNAVCSIVATEGDGGRSTQSIIYQGSTQSSAPQANETVPTSLQAGGSVKSYTVTFTNPSSTPLYDVRPDVSIFSGSASSPDVKAADVSMASSTSASGNYTTVKLGGSTSNGDSITGYAGPTEGTTIPAHGSETVHFQVGLSGSTPTEKTGPLLSIETYLNQVNSASGSGTTLADSLAKDVNVATTAPSPNSKWYLIGAGILVLLIVLVGWMIARRRRGHASAAEAAG